MRERNVFEQLYEKLPLTTQKFDLASELVHIKVVWWN